MNFGDVNTESLERCGESSKRVEVVREVGGKLSDRGVLGVKGRK